MSKIHFESDKAGFIDPWFGSLLVPQFSDLTPLKTPVVIKSPRLLTSCCLSRQASTEKIHYTKKQIKTWIFLSALDVTRYWIETSSNQMFTESML